MLTSQERSLDGSGLVGATGVNLGLARLGVAGEAAHSSGSGGSSNTDARGLDGKSLAHDGAALAKQLQLGDGAAAWRGLLGTGRGRESPKSGGRGLLQEGAHGLGLSKNSIHGGSMCLLLGSTSVRVASFGQNTFLVRKCVCVCSKREKKREDDGLMLLLIISRRRGKWPVGGGKRTTKTTKELKRPGCWVEGLFR